MKGSVKATSVKFKYFHSVIQHGQILLKTIYMKSFYLEIYNINSNNKT